jgi:membrane protein
MSGDTQNGAPRDSADVVADPRLSEEESIALEVEAEVAEEFVAEGRSPHSPEARRERAERTARAHAEHGIIRRSYEAIAPGSRPFYVIRRVAVGTYFDGFIHAGNLAYLSLIALFPFFITATALMSAFGRTDEGLHALTVILSVMPPGVAATLEGPVREVLVARTGPLLWLGALVGLWTVGSLIETIRDILRRAYGTRARKSFWHYRLYSIGLIIGAVLLLLISFSLQVVTLAIEQFVDRLLPADFAGLGEVAITRGVSTFGLFLSLYLLFLSLTPQQYRGRDCPKWPGALVTTLWWIGVTVSLPPLLAGLLSYDMTYGSLAGVMVVLFFFYLIGLGVVIGAELNAALAETPDEQQNRIGQTDDRDRRKTAV